MRTSIGVCSICGGPVTVPDMWHGIYPPVPTCEHCGATSAGRGPVIPMFPPTHTPYPHYADNLPWTAPVTCVLANWR